MFSGEDITAKKTPIPTVLNEILNHYRRTGFPYIKLNDHEKEDELNALSKLDTGKLFDGENFLSDSTGVSLANSYHPHRYEVICNDHRTALYVFGRDWALKKCIEKCIRMSKGINDSKLRSMISIFEGVQVASNFPPGTAKAIYEHLAPDPCSVWDMSMGFGGRLLGAITSKNVIEYYGTEPSTKSFAGITQMLEELKKVKQFPFAHHFQMQGSETNLPWEDGCVDFCFTSPPYFDTEKYAREDTQSFLRYPGQTSWVNNFLCGTFRNCHRILRQGCRMVVNIANVNSFRNLEQCTIRAATENGFTLEKTYQLNYTMMPGKGDKNKQEGKSQKRKEPIFVFKRVP